MLRAQVSVAGRERFVIVRILFVADSRDDVESQLRRLREADMQPLSSRAESADALREALRDESWQVALVDHSAQGFSGVEALRLIAELAPDLPAVTVCGSIDEDTAVATMSAGAVDYVLKDNLARLAPAVRRAVDGADRRRAQRQAAEAARLALFAVDHASLSITTAARDGTVTYLNDMAARMLGGDRDVLVGRRLWELNAVMRPEAYDSFWTRAVEQGSVEFRVEGSDDHGSRYVMDMTCNYLDGADSLVTYGRDVTRRVVAEEQARASEARYRRMVEMVNEGIWASDSEFRTTFVNKQMAAMLGYTVEEMLGRPDTDFAEPGDLPVLERERQAREAGAVGTYDCRFRSRDGAVVWMHVSSVVDRGPDGEFRGSFALCTDITERRLAEVALQAERTNLAAIFEMSPVAMLVLDAGADVVRANRAALKLAAGDADHLLEHAPDSPAQCGTVFGCVHAAEAEGGCGHASSCPLCPLRNGVEAALAGHLSLRGVELSLDVVRGGEPTVLRVRMGAEPMVMNGAPHLTVALDDITDRWRAKRALADSEERFRSLAERVPGFVTIKDSDHRYLYLNSLSGARARGGEETWLGKRPEGLWARDEAASSNETADRALAGEMVDEVVNLRRDAATRHYHSLHFPIARESGPPLVGGLMIDVTDQIEAQVEVRRQAEQLRHTVEGAVLAMSQVVETRDPYTAGHERRVAELATAIAREMGMGGPELDGLRLGALIHDIGKISIPAEILAKPGRLSTVEFNLIKQHAVAGYEILSVIDFGRPVAEMVLQHHERLNGSGYPNGLHSAELLPETRILAVADVVEAMSSHRPYRPALGTEAALAEIREGAGTRYDADVAAACLRIMVERGFSFTP
jgi:PAS domain S-box-containing protein/putative nucleotidyltransferase with HDIG domain